MEYVNNKMLLHKEGLDEKKKKIALPTKNAALEGKENADNKNTADNENTDGQSPPNENDDNKQLVPSKSSKPKFPRLFRGYLAVLLWGPFGTVS